MAVLGTESVWVCGRRRSLPCLFIAVTSLMSISTHNSVHRCILTLVHLQRKLDKYFLKIFFINSRFLINKTWILHDFFFLLNTYNVGTGGTTLPASLCMVLVEGQSSVPSTYTGQQLITGCNSSCKESSAFLLSSLGSCIYVHMFSQTYLHIHN